MNDSSKAIGPRSDGSIGRSPARRQTSGAQPERVLPLPSDTRELLVEFYRTREQQDRDRYESGSHKVRGTVYAVALQRLESDEEVLESYRVLNAAGIEIAPEVDAILDALPNDWRQLCRIMPDGTVWTASVRARMRTGR